MSKWKSESANSKRPWPSGLENSCRALVLATLVTGCAPVTTLEGERLAVRSDAFARYVERVFREQNRVATSLAFALEDTIDPERLDALQVAEEALLAACAKLNELAAARRDGERLGALRELKAARQAPECERAAAEASGLVDLTIAVSPR